MSIIKKGSAIYHSLGKKAKASVSTESGALKDQPYGFNTRFEDKPGTNPEELVGAAHAGCFSMFLSALISGDNLTPTKGSVKTQDSESVIKELPGI